jgi:hypothetical protein
LTCKPADPNNSSCCLPGARFTQVPIQYPVRDFAKAGLGLGIPINMTCQACWSLITAAVACCTLYTQVLSICGFRRQVRGRSQSILTCQACCWSLITAAVACLGARFILGSQSSPVRDFATAGAQVRARSQSILTCQACCWSLITAAVAWCTLYGPNQYPVRFLQQRGSS